MSDNQIKNLGNMANNSMADEKPKAMDENGSVGKQFTPEGAIGSVGQKIGGPFDKEGMVGHQFTSDGAIGGTVQSAMGGTKKTT